MRNISVIIPTYNRPKELMRSIKSVLDQTYKGDIEVIVIDDSEKSKQVEIEKEFSVLMKRKKNRRINYIHKGKKEGSPAARNVGIKKATEEFIAFLDDDDEWKPTKLEKQLKEFDDENVKLVVCYSLDKRFGMTRVSKPKRETSYTDLLRSFNLSSTSSYVVSKEAVEKVGLFDINLPSAQEYDLAIRLAKSYEVRTVPEILMIQNATSGQISTNWTRKIKGILALYAKYNDEYNKLGVKMCVMNHLKVVGLVGLFFGGFFLGNRIYKIIIPFKELYENV